MVYFKLKKELQYALILRLALRNAYAIVLCIPGYISLINKKQYSLKPCHFQASYIQYDMNSL